MKVIDDFIEQYIIQNSDYRLVKDYAQDMLEKVLKDAGIMAIVSGRVKDAGSLREKLIKRNAEEQYSCIADIEADIPDFIGLRIALYFPNDREKVRTLMYQLFDVEKEKQFPSEQRSSDVYTRRFPGYCATHYRAFLKKPVETPLGNPRIEVQVASLLMHAWSEVEHDLTYKQKKGSVSYDEYESLDEINGLVLAGELSLQRLQRLSEARIELENRQFESHYQLASFIYDKAATLYAKANPYLGDVETLYKLLKQKDRLTASEVIEDLMKVDWEDEDPIAQQLIDLYADDNAEAAELVVANKAKKAALDVQFLLNDRKIKLYLKKWADFEKKLSDVLGQNGYSADRPGGIYHALIDYSILPSYLLDEYAILRQTRNEIVHGTEIPTEDKMDWCLQMIDEIADKL